MATNLQRFTSSCGSSVLPHDILAGRCSGFPFKTDHVRYRPVHM